MSLREFPKLFLCRFKQSFYGLYEYLKEVCRYYRNPLFRKADIYLLRHYIAESPYQISKQFLIEKGAQDLYQYGETPLAAMEQIANACDIKENDCFFELGSGRGRCCFWMRLFKKCRVVGVEYIPEFVKISRSVAKAYHLDQISFVYGDLLKADLSSATVIYFYGTCADKPFIEQLIGRFRRLKPGTTIITVSYPLSIYGPVPEIALKSSLSVDFPWGTTDIYIQEIKQDASSTHKARRHSQK